VRFVLDLSTGDGGRVSGQVSTADGPAVPFSGWLELLRLLEDGVGPPPVTQGMHPELAPG